MTNIYTTITDFTEQEVNTAFGTEIVFFDTDAIAADISEWHEVDLGGGVTHANHMGYILKPEFVDNPDAFWEVAQQHEYKITAQHIGHHDGYDMEAIAIYRNGERYDTALFEDGDDMDAAVFDQLGSHDGEITWIN